MKHLILILISITLSTIFINMDSIQAATNDFDFHVQPIFPDSQIGNASYYHINAKPGERVTMQAEVINRSDKELSVLIQSMNAYSGSQGILYQQEAVLPGSIIIDDNFQFKQTVTHPEEVILAPMASEIVEFTVITPEVNGTLLGSLTFQVFEGTENLTSDTENTQLLVDQFRAYNIGVQVEVSSISETPALNFSPPTFSPEQLSILVPLENALPVIINPISGSYTVTKEGDASFSAEGDIPSFKMAPMTKFDYPINWSSDPLSPGRYDVAVTFDVNGEEQSYNENLFIEETDLEDAQTAMVDRGEIEIDDGVTLWVYLVIGILALLVAVLIAVIIIFIRKNKKIEIAEAKK